MTIKRNNPTIPLSRHLLLKAPNNRHGLTLEPQRASVSLSDIQSVIHMGVPSSIASAWESASGGVGFDEAQAKLAAIGESIERYCATIVQLPLRNKESVAVEKRVDAETWHLFTTEQRARSDFPFENIYSEACMYTNAYDFQNNDQVWLSHPFVALRDDFQTGVPTSSGLAAAPTGRQALLRAVQELIERDALMMTWLHSVPARSIPVPLAYAEEVQRLDGEVWAFELTPAYSPFPVIAVAGGIPKRGKWRYSLGVACRDTGESALEKAYLEWNQGVLFAGIYEKYVDTSAIINPHTLKSFDEHAIFYTLHPELWWGLPMFANKDAVCQVRAAGETRSVDDALRVARAAFAKHDIRLYYRDLTTLDAEQVGVRVVRAASPDLAPIFAHQEWPLLGGLADKLASRYPWAARDLVFPNLMPHPLG